MSTPITPNMIKELRERTGVGVGKCKEALEEAKGDMELAISNLRKAGEATAVKKQGRDTNEGAIAIKETPERIAIVEVNAETDFVAKNETFQKFLQDMADEVAATNPSSLETFLQQKFSHDKEHSIEQYRTTVVQKIGENIQIRRIQVIPKQANKSIGVYSHLGGKIVTVAEIEGAADEVALAKDIAMHTAAASPDFLSPEKVPHDVLEHERDIARSQVQNKPANIVDKIVEGKLKAFYDSACLLCQKFVKNDDLTIAELVEQRSKETGKPLKLTHFTRWVVGQK